MPPYPSQKAQLRLDPKLLGKFIYELNIARHHTITYPPGHPVIGQSVHRTLTYLKQLQPENGLLSFGISKDKLVISQTILDEKNPVFKEFASYFFGHDIAVITLRQSLDEKQLLYFLEIIGQSRETIREQGGLQQLMKVAAIIDIQVKAVDYSAFGISNQVSGSPLNRAAMKKKEAAIWERFVEHLLTGKEVQNTPSQPSSEESVSQTVAELLNEHMHDEQTIEEHYDQAITEFLRELDRENLFDRDNSMAFARLQGLASQLNPELRAQLLNSTFRALSPYEKMAENVLSQFPSSMLMEVLETLNSRQATIPPIIFTLLDRLTQCEKDPHSGSNLNNLTAKLTSDGSEELLAPLYAKDVSESFIPREYSETLRLIEVPTGQKPAHQTRNHFWQASFSQQPVESKVSDIVFELAQTDGGEKNKQAFKGTLQKLCGHFLDTGDFDSLSDVYCRLPLTTIRNAANNPAWFQELRTELDSPVFISRVLETLPAWGKSAFIKISRLIEHIGPPAIGPLLDRLAFEPNRALRQFMMNSLVDQGISVKAQAVARLKDSRWYYVRNLIIILRRLGDPSSMIAINLLWHHPHEKVRYEVAKTALVFKDPQGSCHLLEEFAQSDHQRRLSAVKIARHSQDPKIRSSLLTLLGDRNLSIQGLQLKFAALDSLTEQGGKDLLPHLENRFRAFSLWHPRRQMRLRQRILRNLKAFPPEDIADFLSRFSSIKRPALARMIRQTRLELLKEVS